MRKRAIATRWGGAAALGLVLMLLAMPGYGGHTPERPSETLTLVDLDGVETVLTMDDVRAMPLVTEKEVICVGEEVGFIGVFDYTGVRVNALIEKAKAAQAASDYAKRNMYVLFKGTDGYQVITAWPDLKTDAGERVMVAVEEDGKPLPPTSGQFRLLCPGDKYAGRAVMCLERIEIHVVPGVKDKKKAE